MMNRNLKRTLIPGLMATGLVGSAFLSVKPAFARDRILRDIGIGAGAGAATSIITGHPLSSAVNGAAAGAGVYGTNKAFGSHAGHRDLARNAGAGAASSLVTGAVTGQHHPLNNAINGAAAGTAINLLTHH
jgi:hypothetical protein